MPASRLTLAVIGVLLIAPAGPRSLFKDVNSGGSFGSNPLRQELGLGNATGIQSVEVSWPASGLKQVFSGLERNRAYHLREGDDQAVELKLPPLNFDLSAQNHHAHRPLAGQ